MKRRIVAVLLILLMGGCSGEVDGENPNLTEAKDVGVEDIAAGEYYLEYTYPAVVEIWTLFDDALDDAADECFSKVVYNKSFTEECMRNFIEKYEEMKVVVEMLPVEGLEIDREHLEKFQENSLIAIDYRIEYTEKIIGALRETGINTQEQESAMRILEESNSYSIESMHDIERYEEEMGYQWD